MQRRALLKSVALLAAMAPTRSAGQLFDEQEFRPPSSTGDRLDQGPFDVDQDQGWLTILFTTPSEKPQRNPGLGLVGYTWEESGPSLAARAGRETLERHVENISSLPFVDVLYIRCDWRNVQSEPGKLNLHPIWDLTLDAARRHGLRVAFRVQLSNPEFQPDQIALPEFLRSRIPLVKIGRIPRRGNTEYIEPRYDHPEFQKAFAELNDLLAGKFDGDPLIEWVDLMQYGFWGEGHTSNLSNPFNDFSTAEQTFAAITSRQLQTWKKTPLAVNTQPDISNVGNRRILAMAAQAGAWLRSDSIVVEEPIQIDQLANRAPWLAAILEDGYFRQYDASKLAVDASGVNILENYMLHTLDLRANYWSLWTEAANLARYFETFPRGFDRAALGYRIRPSWVWQRKRHGGPRVDRGRFQSRSRRHSGRALAATGKPGWPVEVAWNARFWSSPRRRYPPRSISVAEGYTGKMHLSAALELRPGVIKPLAWTCEQPLNMDGSIAIDIKRDDDPGWRKGV